MKALYFIPLVIFLFSCEGFVGQKGNIKSIKNGSNIDSVKVELLDIPIQKVFDSSKNETTPFVLSDSNGNFKVRSQFIGMVKPPKYRIRFSKPGYETIELKFNGNNDTTHLSNDSLLIQLKENGIR